MRFPIPCFLMLVVVVALLPVGLEAANPQRFAVVELYTSEGCSSCPPADRLLAAVKTQAEKKGLPVYVLGFHVDYWNYLGWKDRFSSQEISIRQRLYARGFGSSRVYTPQAIVNGSVEFNGSSESKMLAAINGALKVEPTVVLQANHQRSEQAIEVDYQIHQSHEGLEINLAAFVPATSTAVASGENADRRLEHVNAVCGFSKIDAQAHGTVQLEIPPGLKSSDVQVLAFVSRKADAVIVAAALSQEAALSQNAAQ